MAFDFTKYFAHTYNPIYNTPIEYNTEQVFIPDEQTPDFQLFQTPSIFRITTPSFQQQPEVKIEQNEEPKTETVVSSPKPKKESSTPVNSHDDSLRNQVAELALKQVGGKYRYGGTDPKSGLDCSGLPYYVYKQIGYKIPRNTVSLLNHKQGIINSFTEIKKGDVIITPGGGENKKHALISVSDYNPSTGTVKVVSASNPKKGIVIKDITSKTKILGIRRFIGVQSAKYGGVLIPKYKYLF